MTKNNNDTMLLLLLTILPGIATADDAVMISAEALLAIGVFLSVQGASIAGHLSAALPDWADWRDTTGTEVDAARRRLRLARGALCGVMAGNIAFYGAHSYTGGDYLPALIAAIAAAHAGDRFLAKFLPGYGPNPKDKAQS